SKDFTTNADVRRATGDRASMPAGSHARPATSGWSWAELLPANWICRYGVGFPASSTLTRLVRIQKAARPTKTGGQIWKRRRSIVRWKKHARQRTKRLVVSADFKKMRRTA